MVTIIKKLLFMPRTGINKGVGLQGPSIAVEKSVHGATLSHVSDSQLQTKVPLSLLKGFRRISMM
jgi:hypothetical protein